MQKVLTVIIPAYNMEALLPRCLESLPVDETLEVLIVNDGSTDRTGLIAHDYAAQHPANCRVIDKPNGHYGSCINTALPQATGAYVKILDADDTVETDALRSLLEILREEAGTPSPADAILTDWTTVNPAGETLARQCHDFLPEGRISLPELDRLRRGRDLIAIHAVCYRKALFDRFNYRQTEGCSYTDTEWVTLPMAHATAIRHVPLCVTHYLTGRDGQSMASETFARDFHLLGTIALGLIKNLQREAHTPAGADYLTGCSIDLLGLIYRSALFGFDGHTVSLDLKTFDRELRDASPEIHSALNDLKMPSRRITYLYIRDWRRHNTTCTIRFGLYKIYLFAARTLLRLRKPRGV